MFQFLLNPWMLTGLLGIALPVMAHLLSRRRFDVIEWGAMQFLNPSRKTRRRLKLEELLLLLLRIGLICLIVLSMTRPLIPSGWLSGYHSAGSRTVVIVVDGSNSMSRSDGVNSVHQNAIRRAVEFLQTLGPDDSAALIDARDQPKSIIDSPLRDLQTVTDQIRQLPSPGGACGILPALEKAIAILGRSSSSAREVVIFSDRQSTSWRSEIEADWNRIDDLLKFPAVRPHVWVVDVAPQLGPINGNISVGKIEMSREMSVPDFPIRLRVAVRNDSDQEIQIPVRLLLDGQALVGESQNPSIPSRSEMMLEFNHAIRAEGTHVLSVEAEVSDDSLMVDNISHAAVHVASSLSVLLINGTPSVNRAARDTFFAELAFAPAEGKPPWVSTRVVEASELKPSDFQSAAVAVFCNVSHISADAALALAEFVARGNGVIISCGPETTPESFRKNFGDSGLLSQLQILRTREAPPQAEDLIHVTAMTIQPGWLERFRSDPARSFLKASFRAWCVAKVGNGGPNAIAAGEGEKTSKQTSTSLLKSKDPSSGSVPATGSVPVVLTQLSTSDPLILESRYGDGVVLVLTSTLDRKWNDLPTRSDFLPFLHEAVFHAASARSHRNVSFAEPLVSRVVPPSKNRVNEPDRGSDPAEAIEIAFTEPGGKETVVAPATDVHSMTAVLTDTFVPGIYRMKAIRDAAEIASDSFVVNYDHSEDNHAQLTADDKARLATNDRVRFSDSLDDLTRRMYGNESRTELWAPLLTLFLLFLVAELLLTRRAIYKGYGGESLTAT
jgi:hypothetical protein